MPYDRVFEGKPVPPGVRSSIDLDRREQRNRYDQAVGALIMDGDDKTFIEKYGIKKAVDEIEKYLSMSEGAIPGTDSDPAAINEDPKKRESLQRRFDELYNQWRKQGMR